MKRRTLLKASTDASRRSRLGSSTRGGHSSTSNRVPVKKTSTNRASRSVASSTLGLKKAESTSENSSWSSDESGAVDHVAECQRLREQLERVLVDHQRQDEEIVALRALAKSLKEEVTTIRERRQLRSSIRSSKPGRKESRDTHLGAREFFKLDVLVEELQGENAELRHQLEASQEELKSAQACIGHTLPMYKLAAVKANAELSCTKSQLQQERVYSDRLQRQIVKYKARQHDVPVRVSFERDNNQEKPDEYQQERDAVRLQQKAFFRQCMRLQESRASSLPEQKQRTQKSSENENTGSTIAERKTQTALASEPANSSKLSSSLEPDMLIKSDELIHEDLLGLDLSQNNSKK